MKTKATKYIVCLASLFVTTGCFFSNLLAADHSMSGKAKMTVIKKEVIPVGDGSEAHILILTEARGTNTNTGDWIFMDGAESIAHTQLDLVKGNGTHNGYFVMSKEGNQTITRYEGSVKTVLSPENKPLVSFEGTWTYYKCSGIFEGCQGQGEYKGNYISETDYIVEFNGVLKQ